MEGRDGGVGWRGKEMKTLASHTHTHKHMHVCTHTHTHAHTQWHIHTHTSSLLHLDEDKGTNLTGGVLLSVQNGLHPGISIARSHNLKRYVFPEQKKKHVVFLDHKPQDIHYTHIPRSSKQTYISFWTSVSSKRRPIKRFVA